MTLEISALSVDAGGARLVRSVSLSLARGEMLALIGPNGAGKSTLLRAAIGRIRPSAGEVAIAGEALAAMKPARRARCLAYLPQERRIEWNLTVRELVSLGRLPHGEASALAADHPAVTGALRACAVETLASRRAFTLSGGEAARALLARALAVNASFLMADEPTAQLDPYHQLQVLEALQAVARRGVGVLIVLHDLNLAARFADRIALMAHGALVCAGPPAEVLQPHILEPVYGVRLATGEVMDGRFVIPWTRLNAD
jgi:iron complex transport system ATP-binding protein